MGGVIDALLDSGAEVFLISEDAVKKGASPTQPLETPVTVAFANRSRVAVNRQVPSFLLSRGTWTDSLRCVVVPRLSVPLFLGPD